MSIAIASSSDYVAGIDHPGGQRTDLGEPFPKWVSPFNASAPEGYTWSEFMVPHDNDVDYRVAEATDHQLLSSTSGGPRLLGASTASNIELEAPGEIDAQSFGAELDTHVSEVGDFLALSDRDHLVLSGILHVLRTEAARNLVQIKDVRLDVSYDPDEDVKEYVVTVWTPLPVREALHFWDLIGYAIGEWELTLRPNLRKVAYERFTLDVTWDVY